MGIQAMKHEALLREWREAVAECRASGKSVRQWCKEQEIREKKYYYWEKRVLSEIAGERNLPEPGGKGHLTRIVPEALRGGGSESIEAGITIRHGESVIIFPAGSCPETVASLVKALNRHA
jgi:putative transposase